MTPINPNIPSSCPRIKLRSMLKPRKSGFLGGYAFTGLLFFIQLAMVPANAEMSFLSSSCDSEECLEISRWIKEAMDKSYNPCDNFYMYACGNWTPKSGQLKANSSPSSPTSPSARGASTFSEQDRSNMLILKDILENLEPLPTAIGEIKLKDYYTSCLNKFNDPNYLLWLKLRKENETLTNQTHLDKGTAVSYNYTWQEDCVWSANSFFPDVLGRLFVQRTLPDEKWLTLYEIYRSILSSYFDIIKNITWMSELDKIHMLLDGFKEMGAVLGHPLAILNTTIEGWKYEKFLVKKDEYLFNNLRLGKLASSAATEATVEVNAFYSRLAAILVIPAGIAMEPTFSTNYPPVVNFARMGGIIAHEMTHAFSTFAGGVDGESPPFKYQIYDPLISDKSTREYHSRRQCIEDQYGDFGYCLCHLKSRPRRAAPEATSTSTSTSGSGPGMIRLKGNVTLEENFADVAGIQVAFQALLQWESAEEGRGFKPLPGLGELTKEQLFFINSAQGYCRAFSDDFAKDSVLSREINATVHSPDSARVFGQMINFPEFSKAFNCPLGSLYNPQDRCPVFD